MANKEDETRSALMIYLDDHSAGAAAGTALAERIAREHQDDPEWSRNLRQVADAIGEDAATLDRIRAALGATGGRLKRLLGRLGEALLPLKSNGTLLRRGPLDRVVAVETMIAGIGAKRRLWKALRAASCDMQLPADVDLGHLIQRADDQLVSLGEFHQRLAAAAFGPERALVDVG